MVRLLRQLAKTTENVSGGAFSRWVGCLPVFPIHYPTPFSVSPALTNLIEQITSLTGLPDLKWVCYNMETTEMYRIWGTPVTGLGICVILDIWCTIYTFCWVYVLCISEKGTPLTKYYLGYVPSLSQQ